MHPVNDLVGGGDADAGEAGPSQAVPVFGEGQCPGDAPDVAAPFGAVGFGQVVFGEDVGDAEPAAGPEHAEAFGEDGGFVPGQVDHAVGDDHVDRLAGQRDRFDVSFDELDVGGVGLGGVVPGEVQHFLGHVQAVGLPGGADPAGGQQHVDAAAGTQVEYRL